MNLLVPEKVDVVNLPSVAFHDWKRLPKEAGLYFVLTDEPVEILYIGQSRDFRSRWRNHKLLGPTMSIELSDCRIAWFILPPDYLNTAEIDAIAYWCPKLNCRDGGDVHIVPQAGPYKKKLIRLPPDILAKLEQEAKEEDRSLNGQLVHRLRECFRSDEATRQRHPPAAPEPR